MQRAFLTRTGRKPRKVNSMKTSSMLSIAAGAMLVAGAASAQVVGGVTGQVGATVQVPPVAGTVGSVVRDTGQMTRETVRDTGDVVRDARPDVDAQVRADVRTSADADADSAEVNTGLQAGAMVHASDGAMLGTVTEVTRNTAGRATAFTLRTADGALRTLPTAGAMIQGGAVIVAR